ncbi:MAG: RDD family protein [Candidatus Eremiobacteraeota bacterium]|nr:RDD family protein [Candidatus Eremiobacteraeota bacterium]
MTEEALAIEEEAIETRITTLNYGRFLRRLMALAIDVLLLSGLGLLIVIFFRSKFMGIGHDGWIIGYAICAAYFTLTQGPLFNGQSLGMYIFELRVIGKDGGPVSYPAAFARFFVLSFPFFLTFWSDQVILSTPPPGFQLLWGIFLFLMIGIPVGSGVLVLLHPERRAFHDFISRSWVTEPGIEIGTKLTEKEAMALIGITAGSSRIAWRVVIIVEMMLAILISALLLFQIVIENKNLTLNNEIYNVTKALSAIREIKYPSLSLSIRREQRDKQIVLKQDFIISAQVSTVQFKNEDSLAGIREKMLRILDRELPGGPVQGRLRLILRSGFELGIGHYWKEERMDYIWDGGHWMEEKRDEPSSAGESDE